MFVILYIYVNINENNISIESIYIENKNVSFIGFNIKCISNSALTLV